jgi:hypothetical protein
MELHDLSPSSNITKEDEIVWVCGTYGEKKNAYRTLMRVLESKKPMPRPFQPFSYCRITLACDAAQYTRFKKCIPVDQLNRSKRLALGCDAVQSGS